MRRSHDILVCLLVLICALVVVGCKQRIADPENRDPIYRDLRDTLKSTQDELEKEKKNREALEKDLARSEPRTTEQFVARKDLAKSIEKLQKLEQMARYFTIRVERRSLEAKQSYEKAFQANQEWPPPQEFEIYKSAKALKSASSNWDSRVSKLHDRIPQPVDPKKKAKEKPKEAEGSEG